jgi:hypothetical protein
MYYRLKMNLAVMPLVKGVYTGAEVIYYTVVYSTLLKYMYSALYFRTWTFRCPRYPSNIKLVG